MLTIVAVYMVARRASYGGKICLTSKSYLVDILRLYGVRMFRNVEVYMIARHTNFFGQTTD